MKSKRGKLEIVGEILDVINRGETKKTRIMQSVYLGWRSFKNYLDFLLENGLIKENGVNDTETHYVLTEEGLNFLNCYRQIKNLLSGNNGNFGY